MGGREGLENIGERVRDLVAADPRAADELRRGRAAFLAEVTRRGAQGPLRPLRPLRARRHYRWFPLALSAFVATAAVGFWLRTRPVAFVIGEAHKGKLGDVIAATPGETMPVSFSEGSKLTVHGGGRIRVLALEGSGARVLIEDGIVDASITPRRAGKTRWEFEVGSYRVTVNGTKFRMTFHSSGQSLRVSTEEGRVTVTGGCLPSPRPVSAGESLDASCPPPEAPPPPLPPSISPAAAVGPIAPPLLEATSKARRARPDDHWRELLAAGQLQDGLRAAEHANFRQVCQTASAQELLALADAARFFGPSRRAVTALDALRQRFPGSMEAGTAAFTLGRMVYERDHAYSQAATWFETYLREQPAGPLMGDAFGRLMEARLRSGDSAGARASAEQYLRRFPEGPYAAEARGILSR